MGDARKVSMLRHRGDHRRLTTELHAVEEVKENDPSDRSLQMLAQDREGDNQWICENIDVVDACRGTSNSYRFRGNFLRYEGPCRKGSKILEGYPIYKTAAGPNEVPKYMYAIDVYPDNWSVKELQGLVRWRIVDFEDFLDQDTCRTESANVNQIDFASDGQPYNYFPTIYCFDEKGGELDGYKSSTINIRCNDKAPPVGYNGDGTDTTGGDAAVPTGQVPNPGGDQSTTTLLLGVLLVVTVVLFAAYFLYNQCCKRKLGDSKSDGRAPTKATEDHTDSDSDHNDRQQGRTSNNIAQFERVPSPPDMEERRPFSSNSIMVDTSSHSGSAGGGLNKASMHTVTKPYELMKRRAAKMAPEPPRTPSPLPELDLSVEGDDFPRNITIGDTDEMGYDDSSYQKQQEEQQQLQRQIEEERSKQQLIEEERLKQKQLEEERLKQQRLEEERLKQQQLEQERLQQEQLERERLAREKLKQEQLELEQLKRDKLKQRQLEQKRAQQQREERQKERGRDPSENDDADDGTFMSESLSNLFQNVEDSLDRAIPSEVKGSDVPKTDRKTSQYEYLDPPEQKTTSSSRKTAFSSRRGKNDDMDLSRRSKFAEARGRWSARGKDFGRHTSNPGKSKNKDRFLDKVVGDLWMSDHGAPSTRHHQQRRSKSLDTNGANEYTKSKRSRSKERSAADMYAQQRTGNTNSRSRSKERSNANAYTDSNRRSRSRERSGANDYHSGQRANNDDRRSRSKERSGASNYVSQNNRSRSRERSGADAFATKRSKSKERSDSNAYAQKDTSRRGRSQERSKANDYASGKGRSKSMEQSEANKALMADNRKRYPEARGSGNDASKGRSRSYDASKAKNYAERTKSSGNDGSKARSRSYDPSNAKNYAEKRKPGADKRAAGTSSTPMPQKKPATTITKNRDGTILVARRRKREDGATVVTKTKYANIYLARKHGVNV